MGSRATHLRHSFVWVYLGVPGASQLDDLLFMTDDEIGERGVGVFEWSRIGGEARVEPGQLAVGASHQEILHGSEQHVWRRPIFDPIDDSNQLRVPGHHLDEMGIERRAMRVLAPAPHVLGCHRGVVDHSLSRR